MEESVLDQFWMINYKHAELGKFCMHYAIKNGNIFYANFIFRSVCDKMIISHSTQLSSIWSNH